MTAKQSIKALALAQMRSAVFVEMYDALLAAQAEIMALGSDLKELHDGTRRYPSALPDPDTLELVTKALKSASALYREQA